MSRNTAGKGRALLEGLELDYRRIQDCFSANPLNEEEAVQQGLTYWIEDEGIQPPTWKVLLEAMDYAAISIHHIQNLRTDLGVTEGMLSMCSCVMCVWCIC